MKKQSQEGELKQRLFQKRVILAMAEEMRAMKEMTERNCIMFEALAKSIGVQVQFDKC